MIPVEFKDFYSYSRYRGVLSPVKLSDEYFCRVVDGNLICSDNECDIAVDGNVVLVTPQGDALHIGKIPQSETGCTVAEFDSDNNLHIFYKVYYDCDRRHGGTEELVINTHLDDERRLRLLQFRLIKYLSTRVKGWVGGSLRNSVHFTCSKGIVLIEGLYEKQLGYGRSDLKTCEQRLVFNPSEGFILQPTCDDTDPIFQVIRRYNLLKILNDFNKSIGLGKQTTFYLTFFDDKVCEIADISDGSCEQVTRGEIIDGIKDGLISVVGIDLIDGVYKFRRVEDFR